MDTLRSRGASTIIPGFQDLHEGDLVPAHHSGRVALPVARLEPERHLVFGHPIDASTRRSVRRPGFLTREIVWGFHLTAMPADRTRLVVRTCMGQGRSTIGAAVSVRIMEGLHHLMQRRQLTNIKIRAEGLAAEAMPSAMAQDTSTPTR